ncbi:MAG: hypothetical protein LW698_01110 [Planctomycetaceae bacterium]|nr:hypothetical protein [Planctomycetaceae bacterium]
MTAPQEDSPCSPAADLGPMWDVLDALPRTTASATLAATTVELAAVAGVRGSRGPSGVRRHIVRWLGPAATVAAALFTGIVAGRFTAPDPDLRILEHLPLVQHFDLLREAGSTKFLEEMQRRRYPLPPRLMVRKSPEVRDEEKRQFEAAVAELRASFAIDPAGDRLAARRAAVQALPVEERVELERAAESFARLSTAERRALDSVARSLVDPARPELREAAVAWHQWLLAARPEDRPAIVARGTDKRLEWLDWYAARFEGRGGDRPPRVGPDLRPRWPRAEGTGEPPRDGPAFEPPRGPRREERPPFRPEGRPRPAFPEDAARTPAPPR